MGISRIYRSSKERAILSYDFQDIVDGSGNIKFYPVVAADTGTRRILYKDVIPTQEKGVFASSATASTTTAEFTRQFTSKQVTRAISVGGQMIMKNTCQVGVTISSAAAVGYFTIKLQKVTGAGTTDIVSVQRANISPGTGNTSTKEYITILDVPSTTLAPGDYFQLEIYGHVTTTGGSSGYRGYIAIPYDPQDEQWDFNVGGSSGSRSIAAGLTLAWTEIPFKIDI